MKRFFRTIGYLLIAGLFSVALSGCGKQKAAVNPNANKVRVWSFEDEDVWKPIKKEFESKNKGFSIVYEKQTLDASYETRVLNSILAGQGPDVWAMPNDWVYRHKGQLTPMPSTLTKALNMDNQFVQSVNQSVIFDKKVYALSPSSEPLIVFYNPKIFQDTLSNYSAANKGEANKDKRSHASKILTDVPSNWTDFAEAVRMLTVKNGDTIETAGVAMGNDKALNSQDILYLLMMQNQTSLISDDLQLATFNLPASTPQNTDDFPGKRALDFYTSFSNPSDPNYSFNDTFGDGLDAFANGKVAMLFGYSSLQNTLAQKYPTFKYKKDFVPQLTDSNESIIDYARFNAFGVSNLATNPTVAWNLVYSLSTATSNDFASGVRVYTSQKASSYDVSIAQRNGNSPDKLELATAKSLVKGRYPVEFDSIIRNAIYATTKNIQDSRAALDYAANSITELLRKTSW